MCLPWTLYYHLRCIFIALHVFQDSKPNFDNPTIVCFWKFCLLIIVCFYCLITGSPTGGFNCLRYDPSLHHHHMADSFLCYWNISSTEPSFAYTPGRNASHEDLSARDVGLIMSIINNFDYCSFFALYIHSRTHTHTVHTSVHFYYMYSTLTHLAFCSLHPFRLHKLPNKLIVLHDFKKENRLCCLCCCK